MWSLNGSAGGYEVNLMRQYYCYSIALMRLLLEGFPILKSDVDKLDVDQGGLGEWLKFCFLMAY